MGWPKKNEQYRLYHDKPKGTFLMINIAGHRAPNGDYMGLAELYIDCNPESPTLCSINVSPSYITASWLKRAEWSDLPKVWQDAFTAKWLDIEPKENPDTIRGFWRVENFQKAPQAAQAAR